MCNVTDECQLPSSFWIQSRRRITHPANPKLNIPEVTSHISMMSCGRHLQAAVKEISAKNLAAKKVVDSHDGVTVKVLDNTNRNSRWV